MDGRHNLRLTSEENQYYFDTEKLIDEIHKLAARLKLPHSLKFTRTPLGNLFYVFMHCYFG